MKKREQPSQPEKKPMEELELARYLEEPEYRRRAQEDLSAKTLLHEISLIEAASIVNNEEIGFSGFQAEKIKQVLLALLLKSAPYRLAADLENSEIKMWKDLERAQEEAEGMDEAVSAEELDNEEAVRSIAQAQTVDLHDFTRLTGYRAVLRRRNSHFQEVAAGARYEILAELLSQGIEIGLSPEQTDGLVKLAGNPSRQKVLKDVATLIGLFPSPAAKTLGPKEKEVQKELKKLEEKLLSGDLKPHEFRRQAREMLKRHTGPKAPEELIQ